MSIRSLAVGSAVAALAYSQSSKQKLVRAILAGLSTAAIDALTQILSRSVLGLKGETWALEEWTSQHEEDAVEPEIAVFDAHHHLWDARVQDKGWPLPGWMIQLIYILKPKVAVNLVVKDPKQAVIVNTFGSRCPMLTPYMGTELEKDIRGNGRGHNVVGTMYIECGWKTPGVEECMEPVREADMVEEVHRNFPKLCQGIVAHADLRLGAAVEPALKYYADKPSVKGIRHSLFWTPDTSIISAGCCNKDTAYDEQFRQGFALLQKHGLSFDCWLNHENIAGLTDLAKTFPGTTIIADHVAMPLGLSSYNRQESFPKWKESLKGLAAHPNVNIKLGGLGMRTFGFGFDERPHPPTSDELADAWGPYIQFCIESFGVDRCIMESNFPVDKVSCSYTVLFNALKKAVKSYSMDDKKKLFELNAKRIYRI